MAIEHNFLTNILSFIFHIIGIGFIILAYNYVYIILDNYYIQYQCYSWFQTSFIFCNYLQQIRSMLDFLSNNILLLIGIWYFYPIITKFFFN